MAVACCDTVRLACDELRTSAELHDTTVARAEAQVRSNPNDDSARERATNAYKEKVEALNQVLQKNIPVIEDNLQQARQLLKDDATKLKNIDRENAALKQERKMLKGQLEEAKAANNEAKLEESTLLNQLAEAQKAATTARKAASVYEDKGPFEYHPEQGKLFAKLTEQKLSILETLETYRVTFNHRCIAPKPHGHGYELQRLDQDEFNKLKNEASRWNQEEVKELQKQMESLEASRAELIQLGWPEESADIYDATEAFAQVQRLAGQWDNILSTEDQRRTDRKGTLDKFLADDAKLLQWCRQERTNMEAQTEPHHVQEFCTSLVQNIGTMEENFAHLGDTGEALLPNKVVERALVEVNEVWLNLQITAYERQRHIMLEIRQKSKLEIEVRAFANFSTKLKEFLEETINILTLPIDKESIEAVAPVLANCRSLLSEFSQHSLLSDHLFDFSRRMERIRDNYNVLRNTVFSKLTFLSTDRRTVEEVSSQRREEYMSKIGEIKGWLKAHSDGESWESIHEKVKRIQGLVDRQLETNPDEEEQQEDQAEKEVDGEPEPEPEPEHAEEEDDELDEY